MRERRGPGAGALAAIAVAALGALPGCGDATADRGPRTLWAAIDPTSPISIVTIDGVEIRIDNEVLVDLTFVDGDPVVLVEGEPIDVRDGALWRGDERWVGDVTPGVRVHVDASGADLVGGR